MKAKDTVIKVEPHSESIWCPHCGEEFGIEDKIEGEKEAQAEISFNAGYKQASNDLTLHLTSVAELCRHHRQAGIKEAVEWIEGHSFLERCDPDTEGYFCTYRWLVEEGWQAQLKEWGL